MGVLRLFDNLAQIKGIMTAEGYIDVIIVQEFRRIFFEIIFRKKLYLPTR